MTKTVVLIDYGSGNLRSAEKALIEAARRAEVDCRVVLTNKAERVATADAVVLPGVGAFADCRAGLAAVDGMEAALHQAIIEKGRPFLGICVGMQLLADRGLEYRVTEGLGWIGGDVKVVEPAEPGLKVPHMGWNNLLFNQPDHPLFKGMSADPYVYFVHSYSFHLTDPAMCLAEVDYGGRIAAVIGRDNIVGTQFHPEKSQEQGLTLLQNFMTWSP